MYTGTCYIGVVGPESGPYNAMASILNIARRDGDGVPVPIYATKGYEARQQHFNKFMASGHDFMLLLDHDMIYDRNTLERLRAWGKPYVSGLYMRRRFSPMMPIWFEPWSGAWPYRWFLDIPERGRLHEIGASGWGCILIHREVVEETRKVLKGEPDVLEDDMDVWPYDLGAVLRGDEELRVLRGAKGEIVGSDVRYPFYALQAGYQLYGDPDVRPAHVLHYPLTPDDYEMAGGIRDEQRAQLEAALEANRQMIAEALA